MAHSHRETLALLFGVIAGCALAAIQWRGHLKEGLPLWDTLLSPKIFEDLDLIDKRLAVIAGVAFLLCLGCIMLAG